MIQDALKDKKKRVPRPRCHLKVVSTGTYNYRSLGIKKIRKLNMSRGGREGNNALVKDLVSLPGDGEEPLKRGITSGLSFNKLQNLMDKKEAYRYDEHVRMALERGHPQLAAHLIKYLQKSLGLGCNFSKFHLESLTKTDQSGSWDPPIREASAKKAADFQITPLHTACVNPSIKALEEIYAVYPDLYVNDAKGRRAVHYAAVSPGTGALEFLLHKGAFVQDAAKDGVTPLIMAAIAGRERNVELIVKTLR